MAKRMKPALDGPVIKTLEEADNVMARIAALQRHVVLVNVGLNDDIAGLKAKATEEIEPIAADIDALAQSLARYAEYNKADLFAKRKSLILSFGTFGFRQTTKLVTVGKNTFKRVLEMLLDRDLQQYIRVKHEPDKEALKGAAPELLKTIGCKVDVSDEFYFELSEQEVTGAAGQTPAGMAVGA